VFCGCGGFAGGVAVSIDVFTTKAEGYDGSSGVFCVETSDGAGATVKITKPVNAESWRAISAAVRRALLAMKLTGDVKS
jgi:hypothetical protein